MRTSSKFCYSNLHSLLSVLDDLSKIFVWETIQQNRNGTFVFRMGKSSETICVRQPGSERERPQRYALYFGHDLVHLTEMPPRTCQRQTGPALSHQVRALLGEGNQAYIDNDLPEAMRIMREVIRIEPRATSGWTVLAQCYEDHHEPNKALQLRIIAAHLRHDPEEWDRLARQSRWGATGC